MIRFSPLLMLLTAAPLAAQPVADAREIATREEMARFEAALDRFAIESGFYTTLENLDDFATGPRTPSYQYVNEGGGAVVLRPAEGEPFRRFLTSEWDFGPFVTFQGGVEGPAGDYDEGSPLDRFGLGRPYYLYSPLGLIDPRSGTISLRDYGDSFSRYTLVSYGADGVRSADDLFHPFGPAVTARTISSARLRNVATKAVADYRLVVRGFNLGATPGGVQLLYNGSPAPDATVTSWSGGQAIFAVGDAPPPGALVALRFDGGYTTRAVAWINELDPLSAGDCWALYE